MRQRISILIIISIVSIHCLAQENTYDTLPYVPEYRAERIALFESEPIEKGKIIFIGNSITQFGEWRKLLKDSSVINRGIAGDITFGVLTRLDDVIAREPAKVFIKIGINDIAKGIPEEVIVKNIGRITRKIKTGSPKTVVFVQSLLPSNDDVKTDYPNLYHKNNHVVKVNDLLKLDAKKAGYTYVDLYTTFADKEGNLHARYAVDGLHLNEAGYQLWIALLKKAGHL